MRLDPYPDYKGRQPQGECSKDMDGQAYAIATGRLVRSPKTKDAMPAIAAVEVTRLRRISESS